MCIYHHHGQGFKAQWMKKLKTVRIQAWKLTVLMKKEEELIDKTSQRTFTYNLSCDPHSILTCYPQFTEEKTELR